MMKMPDEDDDDAMLECSSLLLKQQGGLQESGRYLEGWQIFLPFVLRFLNCETCQCFTGYFIFLNTKSKL